MHPVLAAKAQAVQLMEASSRARLGKHQCSVGAMSKVLAIRLGLDNEHCLRIEKAAALHDVGKLYVSTLVSAKCGPLNMNEIRAMQQHPIFGYTHLCSFKQTPLVKLAANIALQHHEKFDGTGYPFGLSGDQISIESRIVSICDVYDALREDRSYRAGVGHDAAMQVITCGDGRTEPSMFDPIVLNAMIDSQEQIRAVFERHHSK